MFGFQAPSSPKNHLSEIWTNNRKKQDHFIKNSNFCLKTGLCFVRVLYEYQNPEIWTCLTSELVWNPNFWEFRFQTPLCVWKLNFGFSFWTHFGWKCVWKPNFEFRFQTMPEIQVVWKLNSYWVSELFTSSNFRHLLHMFRSLIPFCGNPNLPRPQRNPTNAHISFDKCSDRLLLYILVEHKNKPS